MREDSARIHGHSSAAVRSRSFHRDQAKYSKLQHLYELPICLVPNEIAHNKSGYHLLPPSGNREELPNRLWTADTFVDFDHGLNKTINKIREALGDSADNPQFIETVARRGYRFIADVSVRSI